MILRQFLHTEPVIAASYLVGCGGRGLAAIVDPVDPPDRYIQAVAPMRAPSSAFVASSVRPMSPTISV